MSHTNSHWPYTHTGERMKKKNLHIENWVYLIWPSLDPYYWFTSFLSLTLPHFMHFGKRTCINSNKHFCIWSYICALFMCILLLFCVYILAAYISYISYMYGQRSARVYACVCNASVRYRMVAHIAPNATACLTKCAHLKQQQQFRIYIYMA